MRIFLPILILCACSHDSLTLAKVNGDAISLGDFKNRLREIDFDQQLVAKSDLMALKKYILNEMIEETIIQQEGKKMKIEIAPEEVQDSIQKTFSKEEIGNIEKNLRKKDMTTGEWNYRMGQKLLAEKVFQVVTQKESSPFPEEQLRDYYDNNPKLFFQEERVHLLQIVFQDKTQALEAQQKIAAGENFETVATVYGTKGANGISGDVGFVTKGILPEPVDAKAFSMKTGTVSSIIEVSPDYYIIKCIQKIDQKQVPFEDARQQIQNMLWQDAKQKLYSDWLQEKMLQAKIKRNDELLQENFSL